MLQSLAMRLVETFLHFFTPRQTNNHKARALHVSAISFYITLLLIFQIGLTLLGKVNPEILGYASNISVADLLTYTNEKRAAAGLATLSLNQELSAAAAAKAGDMFASQYWAHTSPNGRDPWSFITDAGYYYLFAGENLARDFGDSRAVVEAWMNSALHRDNLLNSRYQDIGFAVVNGKYAGHETTLVVQMFGMRAAGVPTVSTEKPKVAAVPPGPVEIKPEVAVLPMNVVVKTTPKIDLFSLTKNLSLGLVVVLAGVLIVDSALVYRRRVVRLSGHNLAHLMVLIAVLAALNLIGRGMIL